MILEKVISEQDLSKNQISQVLEQAGTILRKIYSVKVNGYWYLSNDNQWGCNSWTDYIQSVIEYRTKDKLCFFNVSFNAENFSFLIKCDQWVLCHGDYMFDHWFVDENLSIAGI